MPYKIFDYDPALKPFEGDIELRMANYKRKKKELLAKGQRLIDFANGHHFFGFHKTENGWYYREWAPAADALYLIGDMNGWNPTSLPLTSLGNGVAFADTGADTRDHSKSCAKCAASENNTYCKCCHFFVLQKYFIKLFLRLLRLCTAF